MKNILIKFSLGFKNFFRNFFYFLVITCFFIYDVFTKYYYMFLLDCYRFKDSLILFKEFFEYRFLTKTYLNKLIFSLTLLGCFTVYPLLLCLIVVESIQDIFIRYFFAPFDILFNNYLLDRKFKPSIKYSFYSFYKGINIIRENCYKMKNITSFFISYFNWIYWVNKFIRYWNALDEFLIRQL